MKNGDLNNSVTDLNFSIVKLAQFCPNKEYSKEYLLKVADIVNLIESDADPNIIIAMINDATKSTNAQ